jgi:hypothetical protein
MVLKRLAHPRHPTLRSAFHEAEKAIDVLLVVDEKAFIEPSCYEKVLMAAEEFFFMVKLRHDVVSMIMQSLTDPRTPNLIKTMPLWHCALSTQSKNGTLISRQVESCAI